MACLLNDRKIDRGKLLLFQEAQWLDAAIFTLHETLRASPLKGCYLEPQ
jgi:hypothetical protein